MKVEMSNLTREESHDLIGSTIAPLPIAFISTIGPDGTYNAAPFSFVAPVCSKPPIICISFGLRQGQKKDTVRNIEFSHDFSVNVVDETLIHQAVKASADYPNGLDEIKEVGLTTIVSEKIKSPRVAESKVSLECRLVQKLEILEELRDGQGLRAIIFGEVLLAHIKDEVWNEGKIEPSQLGTIGRVGKNLYCRTGDTFEVRRS
jgi:flavin reductase (DIM6/NTAB) family NADH-FMN oxidoreductase RutF